MLIIHLEEKTHFNPVKFFANYNVCSLGKVEVKPYRFEMRLIISTGEDIIFKGGKGLSCIVI